ncbi:hypothetical protein PPACK8108_LOCUS8577 [Phakopsora pachyrhizi]|uniref:Uncharacterized protein n=1 Tax=Phakopsora pachyrhizi TaxID=170000 RepID=A0AAV0AYD8_PHAPC|nr:hypothetical protein PPACK8108_LOCUS8577 [Phakopsora pachyrhizi]
MATEENLNEMLDSNEAGCSAHSQSQAWLLDKVNPQFVNLTNVNSGEEVICLLSTNQFIPRFCKLVDLELRTPYIGHLEDKQVALRKLLNQHWSVGECVKLVNMATFCSLRRWFESLEVEDYEPIDWEESKGKRKA